MFGVLLLLLLGIALLTGLALAPFYHAGAAGAHRSVQAMQDSAALRMARGVHHWTSALLILLGGVFLLCGLYRAAYRRPRHRAWIACLGMVLLVLLAQLTGHLLPWDVQAVRTAVVETGIAENAPLVGPFQARLLRGGASVGPQTLTLWYRAHVLLIPGALLVLAAFLGARWRRAAPRAALGTACAVVLTLGLLLWSAGGATPLGPSASPADFARYDARPEWYVLPLHSLLSLFQGIRPGLAFVGTMVLPGLLAAALALLPWLDRRSQGQPPLRWVRAATLAGGAGVAALALMSAGSVAPPFGKAAPLFAGSPPDRETPRFRQDAGLARTGRAVFDRNGCIQCHALGGRGGAIGPALDGETARHPGLDWQIRHLRDPAALVPGSTMPSFQRLKPSEARALAAYLLSR